MKTGELGWERRVGVVGSSEIGRGGEGREWKGRGGWY